MSNDVSIKDRKCVSYEKKSGGNMLMFEPSQEGDYWAVFCYNTAPQDSLKMELGCEVVRKDNAYIIDKIPSGFIKRFPDLEGIHKTPFKTPKELLDAFGKIVHKQK